MLGFLQRLGKKPMGSSVFMNSLLVKVTLEKKGKGENGSCFGKKVIAYKLMARETFPVSSFTPHC
jgi:hypothetical protein